MADLLRQFLDIRAPPGFLLFFPPARPIPPFFLSGGSLIFSPCIHAFWALFIFCLSFRSLSSPRSLPLFSCLHPDARCPRDSSFPRRFFPFLSLRLLFLRSSPSSSSPLIFPPVLLHREATSSPRPLFLSLFFPLPSLPFRSSVINRYPANRCISIGPRWNRVKAGKALPNTPHPLLNLNKRSPLIRGTPGEPIKFAVAANREMLRARYHLDLPSTPSSSSSSSFNQIPRVPSVSGEPRRGCATRVEQGSNTMGINYRRGVEGQRSEWRREARCRLRVTLI